MRLHSEEIRSPLLPLSAILMLAALLPPAAATATPPGKPPSAPSRPVCPGPVAAGAAACLSRVVTDRGGTPLGATGPTGYSPAQFHGAYELPTEATAAQTIAIVDAYDAPTIEADLGLYSETFGLPECTTANGCFRKVNQEGVEGSYPHKDGGWALEISLDVEIAHAICQNCQILLVEASTNSFSNLKTAVNAAAALGADEISNSYGGAESPGQTADAAYDHPGVAITASAGDSGYAVEYPAASPYVTAVGGTTLTLGAGNSYGGETVWSGSGSGCSAFQAAQAWQLADGNWSLTGCGAKRGVADVAADASPASGASVYDSTVVPEGGGTGWFKIGGTSLSAPLIAAVYALAGGGEGEYPAAGLYGHQEDSPPSLHDVTGGSDGSCGGTTMCEGAPGYDGPTGLGTPRGLVAFGAPAATSEQPLTTHIYQGEGTIVSNPAGLECTGSAGKECTAEFAENEEVTLTSSPAAGYRTWYWENCPSPEGHKCTVTMDEAKDVGVLFLRQYEVNVSKSAGSEPGLVLVYPAPNGVGCDYLCTDATYNYPEGEAVTLAAYEYPGNHLHLKEFTGGTGDAAVCNGETECSFSVTGENSGVEAVFVKDAQNTLSIDKEGGGLAFIKSNNGIYCSDYCSGSSADYYSGEEVEVSWTLGAGTDSIEWSTGAGTCTGSSEETEGSCTVTMSAAKELVAKLE